MAWDQILIMSSLPDMQFSLDYDELGTLIQCMMMALFAYNKCRLVIEDQSTSNVGLLDDFRLMRERHKGTRDQLELRPLGDIE
jgi:hypothetical protein